MHYLRDGLFYVVGGYEAGDVGGDDVTETNFREIPVFLKNGF
jgi:hypothetical protein